MSGENKLQWQDYVVFVATLAVSGGIGIYYALSGGQQKTTSEFLMGNRRLSLIPVVLSIYMSYISAITVLGTTAEMYQYGTQQLMQVFGTISGYLVAAAVVIPVVYPLKLVSMYQYYEMRYNSRFLRRLLALIAIFQTVFYAGMTAYAPSTALEAVTGFPAWATVLCTLLVATLYTSLGGMKAVVWTDAFQALVFFGGMTAVLIVGAQKVGGMDDVWKISTEGGRIEFFNMDIDPRTRMTFWNTCVGRAFTSFGTYGIGQSVIQRYSGLTSLRSAKLSVLLNIPLSLVLYILVGLIGLVIYAYYTVEGCDPLRATYVTSSNQLLPYFIVDVLGYPGFPGLLISILFSGALSSISTSMSSTSAVLWKDFLEPIFSEKNELFKAFITKMIVVIFGLLSLGMSFLVAVLPGHILEIANAVIGAIGGATGGALLLGLFFPCANWIGASSGVLAGLTLGVWVNIGQFITNPYTATLDTVVDNCTLEGNATLAPPLEDNRDGIFPLYTVSFQWFGVISSLTCVLVGLLVSLMTGRPDPEKLDRRLVIPLFDHFCCCLPLGIRKFLWCGVPRDRDVDSIDTKEPEDIKTLNTGMEIDRQYKPNLIKDDKIEGKFHLSKISKQFYSTSAADQKHLKNVKQSENGVICQVANGYINSAYNDDGTNFTKL